MLAAVTAIDGMFAGFLPSLACIALWASISGIASMALYWAISPQQKLACMKERQQAARNALYRYDGDFSGLLALIKKDLGLACGQMGVMLLPFTISVLPMLALVFCLYTLYAYQLPAPGDDITLQIQPASAITILQDGKKAETGWVLQWPEKAQPLLLLDENKNPLITLPIDVPIPEKTKPGWLTALFPNPLGDIAEASPVDSIYLDLPERHYISFGPGWMRGFAFWYFSIFLMVSFIIKLRFRIV